MDIQVVERSGSKSTGKYGLEIIYKLLTGGSIISTPYVYVFWFSLYCI